AFASPRTFGRVIPLHIRLRSQISALPLARFAWSLQPPKQASLKCAPERVTFWGTANVCLVQFLQPVAARFPRTPQAIQVLSPCGEVRPTNHSIHLMLSSGAQIHV